MPMSLIDIPGGVVAITQHAMVTSRGFAELYKMPSLLVGDSSREAKTCRR
jgi:hypothetical protein